MVDKPKPLPALPTPATLHIDAKNHRGHLIRHFLSEINETGIEGRREGWAHVIEEVLDELGQCLSQGKWLDGVKKWRELQNEKRKREREIERELQRQATVKAKKRNKVQEESDSNTKQGETVLDSAVSSMQSSKELPALGAIPPKAGVKHLFLCVAPPGSRVPVPIEDSGFDIVPGNIGCAFIPGTFALQNAETPTILFGSKESSTSEMVGGTFSFKGVTSPIQHEHLFSVLRLAVYIHLALTLEQHLLTDSNIQLTFPRPKLPPPSPSAPSTSTPTDHQRSKKHSHNPSTSFLPSGLRSLFSSKPNFGHRSSTITPVFGRDITQINESHTSPVPRPSFEFGGGIASTFRFSILGSPTVKQPLVETTIEETKTPFTQTLEQIQASNGLLSTSPGVRFDPPPLVVELAEREKKGGRRLRGDERAGLGSVLGWEGRENLANGMTGVTGFVRQQGIEVLVSRHVLGTATAPTGDCVVESRTVCGRALWRTYRYFTSDGEDESLGAAMEEFVEAARRPCDVLGCKFVQGVHETRLVHNSVRVAINVTERADEVDEVDEGSIEMWESCVSCGTQSKRRGMSNGTYLLSFGKFLELLIYSKTFGLPSTALCEHTDRFLLRRHFGTSTHNISITCSRVEDIFELRVPRLQIARGERSGHDSASTIGQTDVGEATEPEEGEEEREKRELRREIRTWWEGVADHMDKLEAVFTNDDETLATLKAKAKALPRLPSKDDEYDYPDIHSLPAEPHVSGLPTVPSTPPRPAAQTLPSNSTTIFETPPGVPAPPPTTPAHHPQEDLQPVDRLSSLRQTFHRTEQNLYAQLSRTRGTALNDVRRSFIAAARGAEKRLCAWQKKHLVGAGKAGKESKKDGKDGAASSDNLEWSSAQEPVWWEAGYHALPGSNIILREDDWGSVIAFTLSTADYQCELTHMTTTRQVSTTQPLPSPATMDASPTLSSQSSHNHSSFFSAAMNYKLFTSSATSQPDPDADDVAWSAPELFSAVVSRKEHPRDPSSLLSIREVLRQQQKSPAPDPLRFGSLGRGPAPPSAWAKPDVQVSKDEADGVVSAEGSIAGKTLQDFESNASGEPSRPGSRASESILALSLGALPSPAESEIRKGKASSILSVESDLTVGKETIRESSTLKMEITSPPTPPPKDEKHIVPRDQERPRDVSGATSNPSSFTSTLTSGLNNAMRFMLHSTAAASVGDVSRPASPFSKAHHGLLSLDAAGIDERPHIKYDWTIGKRLKFSCTVYYAKQFDLLRKRCGVDDTFIRSLRRSANWAAEGGKSRSNFWKTSDEKFIIKTLVDAWNVADLQVLIDLAPSYFRYVEATANKATVLAKMMGFYTIEIRNLETGNIQSKADLLVMENLFYNQKVSKTFDLKGIQGRKIKASSGVKGTEKSKTLFDGEWIEGQQKTLMLVRPHSKQVLRSAIRSDADFLAKSNIMDYSLLVGVDEEKKQIACGLVDTIGSYTFAKTLEYKAKHGLNSGKETTVIPPAEYQERFVSALDGYFLACPDKWSKPLDESRIISDVALLPSVL